MKLINVKDGKYCTSNICSNVNSILYNDGIPHLLIVPSLPISEYTWGLSKIIHTQKNRLFNKTKKMIKCLIVVHAYGEPVNIIVLEDFKK